jgi:hypothetical protein
VQIDAEHRLQKLAAEERDALAEALVLRKRRRRAEKQLLPPNQLDQAHPMRDVHLWAALRLRPYLLTHVLLLRRFLLLDRGRVRDVAAQLVSQRLRVVRVHLHVKLSPRHRHIGHVAVDEFAGSLYRVHVDQHPVGGLALAAVARHRITVIEMRMLPRVELDLSPRVRAEFQIAVALDPLDGCQFAVSEFLFVVRGRELRAVACANLRSLSR